MKKIILVLLNLWRKTKVDSHSINRDRDLRVLQIEKLQSCKKREKKLSISKLQVVNAFLYSIKCIISINSSFSNENKYQKSRKGLRGKSIYRSFNFSDFEF